MQTLVNQELTTFRDELLQIWNEKRYLGRAEILTKIRASFYNHDRKKAEDLDNQTVVATELMQANITENLRLLIDSVGVTGKYLSSKPFYPPYFIGRQQDLKTVHDQLFAGNNLLMLVNGQGGMGKTSFAAKYWEMYECKYSHLANLYAGLGIADALLTLAFQFEDLQFEPTMPTEERLKLLIQYVQKLEKPCLLILDNVDNETDLFNTFFALQGLSNFHVLLTSRLQDFAYSQKHRIEALSKEEGLTIFKYHYQDFDVAETDLFYQLFDEVQGNTLVIDILAKNLSYLNKKRVKKDYTLAQLLEEVRKNLAKPESQTNVPTEYHREVKTEQHTNILGFRLETPESIVMAMYDLKELSDTEQHHLSIFAVLPPENIPYDTLKNLVGEALSDETLLLLEQKGWIDFNKTQSAFKTNPVVQSVVNNKENVKTKEACEIISFNISKIVRYDILNDCFSSDYKTTGKLISFCEHMMNIKQDYLEIFKDVFLIFLMYKKFDDGQNIYFNIHRMWYLITINCENIFIKTQKLQDYFEFNINSIFRCFAYANTHHHLTFLRETQVLFGQITEQQLKDDNILKEMYEACEQHYSETQIKSAELLNSGYLEDDEDNLLKIHIKSCLGVAIMRGKLKDYSNAIAMFNYIHQLYKNICIGKFEIYEEFYFKEVCYHYMIILSTEEICTNSLEGVLNYMDFYIESCQNFILKFKDNYTIEGKTKYFGWTHILSKIYDYKSKVILNKKTDNLDISSVLYNINEGSIYAKKSIELKEFIDKNDTNGLFSFFLVKVFSNG